MTKVAVLKVAKEGYDVRTASPENLTIDSSLNHFKVAFSGEETFSLNSSNGYSYTKTVTHNLGYKPNVLVYSTYVQLNSSGTGVERVDRFTMLPYAGYQGGISYGDKIYSAFVGYLERTDSQLIITIEEQDDWHPPFPDPLESYEVTDLKLFYIIFREER